MPGDDSHHVYVDQKLKRCKEKPMRMGAKKNDFRDARSIFLHRFSRMITLTGME